SGSARPAAPSRAASRRPATCGLLRSASRPIRVVREACSDRPVAAAFSSLISFIVLAATFHPHLASPIKGEGYDGEEARARLYLLKPSPSMGEGWVGVKC